MNLFALSIALSLAPIPEVTGRVSTAAERCASGSLADCAEMALRYSTGMGVEKDRTRARRLAERSCEQGEALGCGVVEFHEGRLAKALGFLVESCEQGGPSVACMISGHVAESGFVSDEDLSAMRSKYANQCEHEGGKRCAAVAVLLANAPRGDRDPMRAVSFFERACSAGHAYSCIAGAVALVSEEGRAPDIARVRPLLAAGCAKGDDTACNAEAALQSGTELSRFAQTLAVLEPGCSTGAADACFALAKILLAFDGYGASHVGKREEYLGRAVAIFRPACEAGMADGCAGLAASIFAGRKDENATQAALTQELEKACNAGSALACSHLSRVARKSPSSARSPPELAKRACDAGDGMGCWLAAQDLLFGVGMDPDASAASDAAHRGCGLGIAQSCDLAAGLDSLGIGIGKSTELARSHLSEACALRDEVPCEFEYWNAERAVSRHSDPIRWDDRNDEDVVMSFESAPKGAGVLLDGRRICEETPCRRRLSRGDHTAVFVSPSFGWTARRFSSVAGARVSAPVRPNTARVTVRTSVRRVAVSVDGEPATSDEGAIEVVAGRGEVRLADSCYEPTSTAFDVGAKKQVVARLSLKPIMTSLVVRADNARGDAVSTRVMVDGAVVGMTDEVLSVPWCSVRISVAIGSSTLVAFPRLEREKINIATLDQQRRGSPPAGMVRVSGGRAPAFGLSREPLEESVEVATYYLDAEEVTVRGYSRCVSAGRCEVPKAGDPCNWGTTGRGGHPINCVTWSQAEAFCAWARKRLPTGAEWARAYHGAAERRTHPWGEEDPTGRACTFQNLGPAKSRLRTCEVGSFSGGATLEGIHDLEGNVSEWTSSWYLSPLDTRPRVPAVRYVGGSSWQPGLVEAGFPRSAKPSEANATMGFRCALSE